jgi:Type IV secretion system pilin
MMSFRDLVYGHIVPIADAVIIPFLYAIAFLTFLWGIFTYFFNDNEEKRKDGRQFALWGIIGFFVLFSVWGLVRLLMSLLIRS